VEVLGGCVGEGRGVRALSIQDNECLLVEHD